MSGMELCRERKVPQLFFPTFFWREDRSTITQEREREDDAYASMHADEDFRGIHTYV